MGRCLSVAAPVVMDGSERLLGGILFFFSLKFHLSLTFAWSIALFSAEIEKKRTLNEIKLFAVETMRAFSNEEIRYRLDRIWALSAKGHYLACCDNFSLSRNL